MRKPALGIDTATRRASVALAGDGFLDVRTLDPGGRHAADILPAIEALLRAAGLTARDLGGIGVASGPGAFTGLRIGLATAKGLGFALDVAVEGVSTLEAIARSVAPAHHPEGTEVCALIEAGRGEVYAARFRREGDRIIRLEPDRAHDPASLGRLLGPTVLLAGDGAGRLALDPGRVLTLPPLAPAIAAWARAEIPDGARYRPGGPWPNYIRPSTDVAPRRPA